MIFGNFFFYAECVESRRESERVDDFSTCFARVVVEHTYGQYLWPRNLVSAISQ